MVRELVQGVQSLLFPTTCLGCQLPVEESTLPLCHGCLKDLPRLRAPWCSRCGASLYGLGRGVEICLACRQRSASFDQAVSPLLYDGLGKDLVTSLKYRGQLRLIPFLSQLLFSTVRERLGNDPADVVIPVPLYTTRLRERSFNQAQLLAGALANCLRLPCKEDFLIRTQPTLPQAQLPKENRKRNVAGAFALRSPSLIPASRVLLVDDVFTTGATSDACAKALKQAGAERVVVVTVAHG